MANPISDIGYKGPCASMASQLANMASTAKHGKAHLFKDKVRMKIISMIWSP